MPTSEYLIEDLRTQIEKGNVVAVIGAGVSIAATKQKPIAGWTGLLDHGVQRCEDLVQNLPKQWGVKVREQIHSGNLKNLLSGAYEIVAKLGSPRGGEYRRWLRDTVGSLKVVDSTLINSIASLGISLATTNYDGLLEEITGLPPITWKDHSEVERFLRGDEHAILHLHGYWRRPETVIIDSKSYDKALADEHFQFMIRAMRAVQTFLFIGYGAGLKDPNFGAFLKWSSTIFSESEYRHFRLALNDEVDARQAEHVDEERIFVLGYGDDYGKLAPFLNRLIPTRSKSITAIPNNLPFRVSSFIGRTSEVSEVQKKLLDSSVRLLTLTGSGGVGKTRLAIEVANKIANQFPGGVWFVDLDGLSSSKFIWQKIASILGIREGSGKHSLLELIKEHIQDSSTLIILDTCESFLTECSQLAYSLLQSCPGVKILATSREALNIEGETRWEVPPMSYPDATWGIDKISQCDAVKLFLTRAVEAGPSIQITDRNIKDVGDICKRLDGIPLAIELAASRIKDLGSVEYIADRLSNRFQLLERKGLATPKRQQTLYATIAWSYEMLNAQERKLLKRLAVFVGGWTLEIAENICDGSGLDMGKIMNLQGSLLDKSLIVLYQSQGKIRYRLLDSIKEYAWQQVRQDEKFNIRRRHTVYFLGLSETAESDLWGEKQKEWISWLENEHDNIRAALLWSLENSPEITLQMVGNLWRFWQLHSHFREGYHWLEVALEKNPAQTIGRAKALLGAAYLARDLWETDNARKLSEESILLFSKLGDERGEAMAVSNLAILARSKGDYALAEQLFKQSLQQAINAGDKRATGSRLANLGITAYNAGHFNDAEEYFNQSIPLLREWGERHILILALRFLGLLQEANKNYAEASKCYVESCEVAEAIGDKVGIGASLCHLGNLAAIQGNYAAARMDLLKSLSILREIGDKLEEAWTLDAIASLLYSQKKYWMTNIVYLASLRTFRKIENKRGMSRCLCFLGILCVNNNEYERGLFLISVATASHPLDSMLMSNKNKDYYNTALDKIHETLPAKTYSDIWEKAQSFNLFLIVDQMLQSNFDLGELNL